jgi:DNA-binding transcriptional LysR family regulator
MDRVRRLRELWSWLPAFRAAAETEHLPSASAALHLSPPAISRAVQLLEQAVGRPLFERRGRGFALTRDGRVLLRGLRDAMRILDEAVEAIQREKPSGPAIISATSELATPFAIPALHRLLAAAPDLVPQLRIDAASEQPALLERGAIDVALCCESFPGDDVVVTAIGEVTRGAYGRQAARPAADPAYVAYPRDGWPPDRPRRVSMHVPDVDRAAAACLDGQLLAVMPDVLGARLGLRKARGPRLPSSPLYAVYRHPVAEHVRTRAILDVVQVVRRAPR